MQPVAQAPVRPLLRNDQVEEMLGEQEALEKKLNNPAIQDKGVVRDQLIRVRSQLESQRPRPYAGPELDAAVKREAELRAEWTQGMLSQEEMRKSPPGAVDRHLAWEKRNIAKIEEWQNIQRRLHAGDDSRESASIELFRPTASTMNMDGALIAGKTFFMPPYGAVTGVAFSDAQIALLRSLMPDLAEKLATYTNAERAQIKDALESSTKALDGGGGVATKRTLSPEHKAAMKAGREKARKAA